jgi:cell division protein FtsQ
VAALVILGGAVAGLVLSRQDAAPGAHAAASPLASALASVGFRVRRLQLDGAPDVARVDILRAAGVAEGDPIVGIDLNALRQRVEAVGWVKQIKVVRLLPDTLILSVTPRAPEARWQYRGVFHVVDAEGVVIGDADPDRFANLPLVVGEGAAQAANAILPILRRRPALMARVDSLTRWDQRRWDVRLKDGLVISLPATGEDAALDTLATLDRQQKVLSLGLDRIDLRDPEAAALRPRLPSAPPTAPGKAKG